MKIFKSDYFFKYICIYLIDVTHSDVYFIDRPTTGEFKPIFGYYV